MNREKQIDRILSRSMKPGEPAPRSDSCLSAEVIGAWLEDALLPHERALAEAHVAGCERCLAILGTAARTMPVASRTPWWRSVTTVRWLVPATAVAAAVTLWVAVDRRSRPGEVVSGPVAVDQVAAPRPKLEPPPQPQAMAEPARKPDVESRQAVPETPRSTSPAEPQRRSEAPEADKAREQKGERAAALKDTGALSETVSGAPAVAAPPPAQAAERLMRAPQRLDGFAPTTFDVRSPDPAIRWRVTGSSIQRSLDGGLSWESLTGAPRGALLAGSAPSPTVCWLVGRAGAVLVTTDGRTWRQASVPVDADLTLVAAESARAAAVTTSDGRTYRTEDGGATWVLQDTPAASF
jgi:hypothetical protein